MTFFSKILLGISTILLIQYSCSESKSETGTQPPVKALPPYLHAFEDSLTFHLKKEKIPGAAVAIVKDTSIVFLKTYGFRDNDLKIPVDQNTVFRIASLSKGFTGVLTGILVEQGFLNWNDKIIKYLPDFALKDSVQAKRIEIRHLLSHSSGLPYHAYTNLVEDGVALEKIIPRLAKLDLIGKEGDIYAYQNAAFAIIEKVIESATDSNFAELLNSKIFKPAKMNNASASYEELINTQNLALPHAFSSRDENYITLRNTKKYYNAISAGGVNASISDMANWMQVLLGNRPDIISGKTLDYIFTPQIKLNTWRHSRRWGVRRSSYAMGWRVLKYQDRNIAFHGGYVNAYRSEIAIDPTSKIAICVMLNAPHRYSGQIIPDFFKIFFNSVNPK